MSHCKAFNLSSALGYYSHITSFILVNIRQTLAIGADRRPRSHRLFGAPARAKLATQESGMIFQRFAIYFTPGGGPFAEFGACWLGWDIQTGSRRSHPDIFGLPSPVQRLTEAPRRYGFHATLKPPFRLAENHDVPTLQARVDALASQIAPIALPGLELVALGRFLALVAAPPSQDLNTVANTFVRDLDGFRASQTRSEQDARRASRLTPSQQRNLTDWGYPFVMDDFRFHITLTGPLSRPDAAATMSALVPVLEKVVPKPVLIDSVTLAGECEQGWFHQISRHKLTG